MQRADDRPADRGLAGTGFPGQSDGGAGTDFEARRVNDLKGFAARPAVGDGETVDLDQWRRDGSLPSRVTLVLPS